jgi:2-(1,2-epoxy-1,2-dihydrophenyl)acetyl-CoA isomerase
MTTGGPVDYETLLLEVRDGVAHLTLNRPDSANGIDVTMARELEQAVLSMAGDPAVRSVLLTGAGARFCGGGDVKTFGEQGEGLSGYLREVATPLHVAIAALVRLDAPVVAAVQGSAAGAGMGLVGASDLVLAGESAKFVMAYTGIGVTPDGSSSWFLPRLVGLKRALELTLTNRVLSASEALDLGLITRVVPDAELEQEGQVLAAHLAAGPTKALGGAKRLLHGSLESTLESHLARETAEITAAGATRDAAEGIAAFVGKRAPEFHGE